MDMPAIKAYYRSGRDNLRDDFFEPVLSRSIRYKRAVGFFSSTALLSWGKAIVRMVESEQLFTSLLISPNLSEEDLSTLERCTTPEQKEKVYTKKANEIISIALGLDESSTSADDIQIILSWLITTERLAIKFAFPTHVSSPGLFHEKIGIFHFETGEKIAFTGSANESISGHSLNYETIDVFRDWLSSETERVQIKEQQFDEAWAGEAAGLVVMGLSKEILAKVKVRSSQYPQNGFPNLQFEEVVNAAVDVFDTILPGVALYKHQRQALIEWENNNFQGLFEMCTGAGKTITALAGINYLKRDMTVSVVVIACPSKLLVDQWVDELDLYDFSRVLPAYDSFATYEAQLNNLLFSGTGGIIVCTYHALLDGDKFSQLLKYKTLRGALLIADEVHNCNRKRMRQLEQFGDSFPYRIALSATPEREREPDVTALMKDYFNGHTPVVEYGLKEAIADKVLCQYKYYPVPVFLADGASRYAEVLESLNEKYDKQLHEEKTNILCNVDLYLKDIASIIDDNAPLSHMLIFCPPGFRDSASEKRYIAHVADFLSRKHINFTSITAENSSQSEEPLRGFRDGSYQILLGVGCLDEGFSVPSIRLAVMLYSNDSRKQFVQRRGRVLRKYEGKECAIIYDMLLLPFGLDLPISRIETILDKELKRYREFASLALNSNECQEILDKAYRKALGGRNV